MENITFGELAALPGSRRSTTTHSAGSRLLRAFTITFVRIKLPLGKNHSWTDNLYNYNIYIYVYKVYNNLKGGPTRFRPRGVTLRKAGLYGQARNTFGPFPPWVPPIPASRPTSSGLYMCMALPPTEGTSPVVVGSVRRGARNLTLTVVRGTGVPRIREIVTYSERRVKSRKSVPPRGAPDITHSVLSRTERS